MKNFFRKWAPFILVALLAGGMAGAFVDFFKIANHNILFGQADTADKNLYFNDNLGIPGNPTIRMHGGTLQFANDGVTFNSFSAGIPPGVIVEWSQDTAPTGWVFTDGTAYSRTSPTYAALYATIGTKYGIGDGSTTFNVPDLRGLMTRVPDDGAGFDGEISSRANYAAGQFNITFLITINTQGTNVIQIPALGDCINVASGQGISGVPDIPSNTFIVGQPTCTGASPYSATISNMATGSNVGETANITNGAGGGSGSQYYSGSYSSWYTGNHVHYVALYPFGGFAGGNVADTNNGTFQGYASTTYMQNGNPSSETVPFNIYMWKIIKL